MQYRYLGIFSLLIMVLEEKEKSFISCRVVTLSWEIFATNLSSGLVSLWLNMWLGMWLSMWLSMWPSIVWLANVACSGVACSLSWRSENWGNWKKKRLLTSGKLTNEAEDSLSFSHLPLTCASHLELRRSTQLRFKIDYSRFYYPPPRSDIDIEWWVCHRSKRTIIRAHRPISSECTRFEDCIS